MYHECITNIFSVNKMDMYRICEFAKCVPNKFRITIKQKVLSNRPNRKVAKIRETFITFLVESFFIQNLEFLLYKVFFESGTRHPSSKMVPSHLSWLFRSLTIASSKLSIDRCSIAIHFDLDAFSFQVVNVVFSCISNRLRILGKCLKILF